MIQTATQLLTLEAFLRLPETKPASEFVNGKIIQKPMPQGKHSRLQGKLCEHINRAVETEKIALALPELRCTFGDRSLVPDVAVFRWNRIPKTDSGDIANRFLIAPDWSIEILSPEQSQTKVLDNLLHCIGHQTELGWLIDPDTESILVLLSDRRLQLLKGNDRVPVLEGVELELTVDRLFSWLKMN